MPLASLAVSASVAAGSVSSPTLANAATAWVPPAAGTITRHYAGTTDLVANPDRGMYHYTETHYRSDGSGYTPLDVNQLQRWRTNEGVTMVYRVFYLEAFTTRDQLDATYLQAVRTDLASARAAGVRLVVRFAYSDSTSADASPARVLGHIQQFAPVLNASADVISVLQAGFIGRWGEWYYSDSFASNHHQPWQLSAADWTARGSVLQTLLSSTSPDIKVQVRIRPSPNGCWRAPRWRFGPRRHPRRLLPGQRRRLRHVLLVSDRAWLAEQTRDLARWGARRVRSTPRGRSGRRQAPS